MKKCNKTKGEERQDFLPEEELKETEKGLGLIDPEQISGGLLLQINGFPAILHSKQIKSV